MSVKMLGVGQLGQYLLSKDVLPEQSKVQTLLPWPAPKWYPMGKHSFPRVQGRCNRMYPHLLELSERLAPSPSVFALREVHKLPQS